jgi:hypothetical protein
MIPQVLLFVLAAATLADPSPYARLSKVSAQALLIDVTTAVESRQICPEIAALNDDPKRFEAAVLDLQAHLGLSTHHYSSLYQIPIRIKAFDDLSRFCAEALAARPETASRIP